MSVFLKRFFSAIILFLIFIFTFFSKNNIFFLCLLFMISIIALYELSKLLDLKKNYLFLFWFFPVIGYFFYILNYDLTFFSFLTTFLWLTFVPISLSRGLLIKSFPKFMYGLFYIFSLFISSSYLFLTNKYLLLITLLIVWVADISAYIFGKKFGRKKLAPTISPGKTYEGIFGAFLANFFLIFLLWYFYNQDLKYLLFLILVLIPLSVIGDLFESLLKRNVNKKDSGNLIPGHGGVLDRIDGLCASIPFVASLSLVENIF
jgi:phosphatidate cytidylyltransferase